MIMQPAPPEHYSWIASRASLVVDEQFRAKLCQPVMQNLRIVRGQNRRALGGKNRPGIEAGEATGDVCPR